jgi:cytochrome c-type biogenesis protein CcmH/NrfG
MKAQVYQRMGRAPEVIQLLEGVLQQYPDSAKGYLIIGQAYEDVGDQLKALDAYEKASVAGEKLDDSTTVAQARIKMGMLLQILALPSIDNETVTPTP